MNSISRSIILVLITVTGCTVLQGQNSTKSPLKQILKTLEERYDIRFSFESKTIEGIEIEAIPNSISLKEALEILTESSGLDYKVLNKRFIAITLPENEIRLNRIQILDEVIVQNYLTKGLSKRIDGTIEFSGSTFSIFPGLIEPDILQVAQKLPGIVSVEERVSDINIRGGTNDQNLILYEGIRLYQSGHFFGLITAFNPYLTNTVNTAKNGTSAKYGDAVSGLISIEIDDTIDNRISGGAGVNMLSVDGYSKIPLSKSLQLQLSARRSFTDVFGSVTYNAYFDRIFRNSELDSFSNSQTGLTVDDDFVFYDMNAKLLYDINPTSKLRINILNLYNSLDYNQVFTNGNINEVQNSKLNQVSLGIGATYSKNWNNGFSLSLQTYYSNYDLDADNIDTTNEQRLIQKNEVNDYGLRIDLSKEFGNNTRLTGGYQFNDLGVTNFEEVTNPNFRSFIKEVIRAHSLYNDIEWRSKSRNTFVKTGIRATYFEKLSKLVIEPRLSFNQKLLNNLTLEILGELKSQSLTQIIDLQQDFFGIEKRRWQLANIEDVPLITSEQVSVGLTYSNNNWLVSAETYIKNVKDITARSQGFQNQFQFINDIGSYTVKGVEFLINKRFKNISTWLSYTYSKNNYSFDNLNNGKEFANTLDLRHVANASLTYQLNNFKIGLGVNWNSGRPYTRPDDFQDEGTVEIEYQSPNSSRLPNYFRTDISALYMVNLSNKTTAEFGASIWNIFNQNNIINRFYTLDETNTIIKVDNQSLAFTPNFSLRVRF